jgi:positive regulator of sigma E activity
MFKYKNHRFTKLTLIIVSEFVGMVSSDLFSRYVFQLPHNILLYLLCGTILAAIVVSIYDKALAKRKTKAEKELKELTNAVLQIYSTHNK